MGIKEVEGLLGKPAENYADKILHYHSNCLQISLDETGLVRFIELSAGGEISARYGDALIFDTPADELVAIIERDGKGVPDDMRLGVKFFDLDLALWRSVLPSDYDPDEPEDEYRNGKYWMTVGVGRGDFFNADEKSLTVDAASRLYEQISGKKPESVGLDMKRIFGGGAEPERQAPGTGKSRRP